MRRLCWCITAPCKTCLHAEIKKSSKCLQIEGAGTQSTTETLLPNDLSTAGPLELDSVSACLQCASVALCTQALQSLGAATKKQLALDVSSTILGRKACSCNLPNYVAASPALWVPHVFSRRPTPSTSTATRSPGLGINFQLIESRLCSRFQASRPKPCRIDLCLSIC